MIRGVFREFYDTCIDLDGRLLSGEGLRVELGAGTSFFKQIHPGIIATDVKSGPGLDMVVDATHMPFETGSVRSFYAIHCFHHLPSPTRFLEELGRALVPGGGCIIIEPYFGPVARVVFRRLFATERFDMTQAEWDATEPQGAMKDANQALSYVVFERDQERFAKRFPNLHVVHHRPLDNHLRYILSGGINFRPLAPTGMIPMLRGLETALRPLGRWLALHHVLVLRKSA